MTYIPRDATYSTNPIKNYQLWDEQAMLYRPNSVQMADALNSLEATNALQAMNTLQTAAKPVANAISKAGYLLAPLGEAAMFYGAVDAAKRSDDRIPTYSGNMSITQNEGAPILPSVQLDNNGNLSYQLQGGVEENYMLPPQPNKMDDYYKKARQFYGTMKANPQVPFNVFNNFIQGDNKDLPELLNGQGMASNL
jgi:hypothetical protein